MVIISSSKSSSRKISIIKSAARQASSRKSKTRKSAVPRAFPLNMTEYAKITHINGVKVTQYSDGIKHISNWSNYILQPRKAEFINNPRATDPTWNKVSRFLSTNVIWNQGYDKDMYKFGEFMCGDFALTLHNTAEAAGIRCGYTYIDFKKSTSKSAHALNVFDTTDHGLVFVDAVFKLILSKRNFFAQGKGFMPDYTCEGSFKPKISKVMPYLQDYFEGGLKLVEIIW